MSTSDTQLRANVRLLGDVLGRVLVEQGGEELLAVEERIRGLLATRARRRATAPSSTRRFARSSSSTAGRRAARVLALLPAREHRRAAPPAAAPARSTSTRGACRASRSPTPSRACARPGSATTSSRAAVAAARGRARPHRAPDRGDPPHVLAGAPAPRGGAAAARRPELPHSRAAASRSSSRRRSRSSGRPTRCVARGRASSTRSATGSGSSRTSLLDAAPRSCATLRDAIPGAPPPLRLRHVDRRRHGRQPRTPGAETIARGARARTDAGARPATARERRATLGCRAGGCPTDASLRRRGAAELARSTGTRRAVPRSSPRLRSGNGSARTSTGDGRASSLADLDAHRPEPAGPPRRADRRRRASPTSARRVEMFGLPPREARRARPRREVRARDRARRATRFAAAARGAAAARARGARTRDRVDDDDRGATSSPARGSSRASRPRRLGRAAVRDDRGPPRRARRSSRELLDDAPAPRGSR